MSKLITILLSVFLAIALVGTISGCPGKLAATPPKTSPITTSEIAEAVASGAVNSTYSSGTMARYIPRSPRSVALSKIIESYLNPIPKAEAAISSGLCPTLQSGQVGVIVANASCVVTNNSLGKLNSLETLTWAPCNGPGLPWGTWSGGSNFSLIFTTGGTQLTCTGFPAFQGGDVVTRSFFSPTGRINNYNTNPADGVPWNPLTQQDLQPPYSSGPVTVLIDTSGAAQIPNGNSFAINALPANYPPTAYTGYNYKVPSLGETITFSGAVARNITVNGLHIKADVAGYIVWDFTVSTINSAGTDAPLTIDGTNTLTGGTLIIQDNINLVTTSSALAGLIYTSNCGVPIGGTAETTQVAGPGTYTPVDETITFTNTCGTATISPVPSWGSSPFYLFHAF